MVVPHLIGRYGLVVCLFVFADIALMVRLCYDGLPCLVAPLLRCHSDLQNAAAHCLRGCVHPQLLPVAGCMLQQPPVLHLEMGPRLPILTVAALYLLRFERVSDGSTPMSCFDHVTHWGVFAGSGGVGGRCSSALPVAGSSSEGGAPRMPWQSVCPRCRACPTCFLSLLCLCVAGYRGYSAELGGTQQLICMYAYGFCPVSLVLVWVWCWLNVVWTYVWCLKSGRSSLCRNGIGQ